MLTYECSGPSVGTFEIPPHPLAHSSLIPITSLLSPTFGAGLEGHSQETAVCLRPPSHLPSLTFDTPHWDSQVGTLPWELGVPGRKTNLWSWVLLLVKQLH